MASRAQGGATQHHTGGKPPKKVKLKLTIERVDCQTGEVTSYAFKQESGEQCSDGKGNLDFKDKKKWDSAVEIGFKVDNESGCTMAFAEPPVWTASGSCPKGPSSDGEFEVLDRAGLDLTVLDRNLAEGSYGYALRFQSADSLTGYFLLDPVIINGGGGFTAEC